MIEVHTLDRLLSNIVKLNSEYNNLHLVICGDMNAHTSDNPDFVADESLNHTDFLPLPLLTRCRSPGVSVATGYRATLKVNRNYIHTIRRTRGWLSLRLYFAVFFPERRGLAALRPAVVVSLCSFQSRRRSGSIEVPIDWS